MVSEADARIKDPVNGCIGEINGLLQAEAEMLRELLAKCEAEVARLKALVETGHAQTDPRPRQISPGKNLRAPLNGRSFSFCTHGEYWV
ncbi:hypothetical protein ACJRO7_000224 [Eucalyptus globulus]|uniref:LOB domain-containing protein n=1 Tax=Eucalyptus globulus TaxID=34317 RepID=A0ABD3LLW0_EUCGL